MFSDFYVFVWQCLTNQQKYHRLEESQELIKRANTDPDLLSRITTGDESLCYGSNPERKTQTSEWISRNSSRQKKVQQFWSNMKKMGQTDAKEYY